MIPPARAEAAADWTITDAVLAEWVPICRAMGDYWTESFDEPPLDTPECREFAAKILAVARSDYPDTTGGLR